MAWVKLDDQFFVNRKAVAIGTEGRALFIASVCYCAMQRNDGLLTTMDLPVIAAMAGVPLEVGDRLYAEGMWHPEGTDCPKCRAVGQLSPVPSGRVSVHEYLRENPSREQVVARRERAEKAAAVRHGKDPPATSNATSSAGSNAFALPIPSPSPNGFSVHSSNGSSPGTSPPRDDEEELSTGGVPDETWEHYAELMFAKQSAGTIRAPAPWKTTTAKNARIEHAEQAQRWWEKFDVRPYDLAGWLIDGKPGPYAKPREEVSE